MEYETVMHDLYKGIIKRNFFNSKGTQIPGKVNAKDMAYLLGVSVTYVENMIKSSIQSN
jgi:Fe-S cluster assembly iron-binding protein IscA